MLNCYTTPFLGVTPRPETIWLCRPWLSQLCLISPPLWARGIDITPPSTFWTIPKIVQGPHLTKIQFNSTDHFKISSRRRVGQGLAQDSFVPRSRGTQESFHTGWSVPTEWFLVRPPFCFNSSDSGGALSFFLLSSLILLHLRGWYTIYKWLYSEDL